MVHDRFAGSGNSAVARLGSRAAVLVSLIGITMLGNLRSQASEVEGPVHRPEAAAQKLAGAPLTAEVVLEARAADVTADADESGLDDGDDLRLVPAIYAWDPDVRFVYFRHVSKWM